MTSGEYLFHTGFGGARGLGDVWSDIQSVINAAPTAYAVIKDPAFNDFVAAINRVRAVASPTPGATITDLNAGVGLGDIVPYVNAYAWALENKVAAVFIGIGALLVPIGLGFLLGRATA